LSLRIAVDAMGGDRSPEAPVQAAVTKALAAGPSGGRVLLVGPVETLRPRLTAEGREALARGWLELVPASEVIEPDEAPVAALRQKKDATIVVGLRLVREGVADAFVSAGSTGALMAGAFRQFGRIRGVPRPALATVFPCLAPGGREFLFLDLGANADARPEHLRAYGVMGSVYAQKVMGRENPRVGLLNNGTEPGKGSELARAAHELLADRHAAGCLPAQNETWALALEVRSPDKFMAALRASQPPVIARTENDRVLLDPRTVLPEQEDVLLVCLRNALR